MAYEPGTYLKELKAEHQRGEHVYKEDPNCPPCNFAAATEGFSSLDEFDRASLELAVELQEHVDAHNRGEHKGKPDDECIECAGESAERIER